MEKPKRQYFDKNSLIIPQIKNLVHTSGGPPTLLEDLSRYQFDLSSVSCLDLCGQSRTPLCVFLGRSSRVLRQQVGVIFILQGKTKVKTAFIHIYPIQHVPRPQYLQAIWNTSGSFSPAFSIKSLPLNIGGFSREICSSRNQQDWYPRFQIMSTSYNKAILKR